MNGYDPAEGRRLANLATPGPWVGDLTAGAESHCVRAPEALVYGEVGFVVCGAHDECYDTRYIAYHHPTRMLALLDRLEALEELEASLRDGDDYPAARGLTQRTCIALAHLWGMREPAR